MRCLGNKHLQAYADGELTDDEAARLDRHLNACPVCRERVLQLRSAAERVKAKLSSLEPARIPAPPPLRAEEPQQQVRRSPFWQRVMDSSIRVPAAAVVMAGLFVFGVAVGGALKGPPRAQEERRLARRAQAAGVPFPGAVSVQVSSLVLNLEGYSPIAQPKVFMIKE